MDKLDNKIEPVPNEKSGGGGRSNKKRKVVSNRI